ncbi:hypothetical protein [Xanthomonas arboricola]|uniref:Peptidoglycan-binding protein n=1 Tax=Xanthomonas arboricola TaxID=56448 RepID=A0AAU9I6P8_9XANT|nr:hypothetical protein [Xanthomonas arboricola]CAE6836496.1 hypothetical protein XA1314C_37150 [Xanthomonas arboricola]CAE6836520.1 hypothetical protein XA1314C_37150 [Xanthomonas arboricola]
MVNQLAQFSPLDAATYVQQQGEMGRQRGQQNKLAQLASQSYSTPADQQGQLLGQMAAIDPKAAQTQQTQFESTEGRRNKTLANMSNLLVNAPEQARAGLYQQMLPTLKQFGVDAPAAYDATTAPVIDQTARALYTAYSGNGAQGQVQSTYVDAQGNRVAILRNGSTQILGQDAPKVQIIDSGDGFYGINKSTLQGTPVVTGGAPAARGIGSSAQGNTADDKQAAELGREFYDQMIQSGLNDQQAMSAVEVYLSRMTRGSGSAAVSGGGGQQLRSAPAKITPYQQQQLELERERDRDAAAQRGVPSGYQRLPDGSLQAIPGGPADKPTVSEKPMPPGAMKQVFDLQDQLQGSENVMTMTQKHLQRLEAGQLDVRPGAAAEGWMRNKAGLSDANSRNLAEWDADRTEMVNESLRLNKGVQTEGDAARAIKGLMEASDAKSLKQSMARLQAVNQRAIALRQQQIGTLYRNYGRGPDGEPLDVAPRASVPAADPAAGSGAAGGVDDLLSKYGIR